MRRTLAPAPPEPPPAYVDDQAAARIPAELRNADRWIPWRWQRKGPKSKPKKPPFDPSKPRGHQFIDPFDPANWRSLDAVRQLGIVHRGGVCVFPGFSLGHEGFDDLVGNDFDHCLDEVGCIRDSRVEGWVKALDSYTERTPSGDGLRVWIHGSIPVAGRRNDQLGVEIYARDRYFTVTGQQLDGTPSRIHRRQKALDALWREVFGESDSKPGMLPFGKPNKRTALSDDELLDKARRAKNGDKFSALFDRGETDGCESPSSADQALMNLLAFWTGCDAARMEALFSRSALGKRGKWVERDDYRQRTIAKAIADCKATYGAPPGRNGTGGPDPSSNGKGRPQFANSIPDGEGSVRILMPELIDSLRTVGKGWPKRIGETLFVASADFRPVYLESSTQFMGWLDGTANVYWSRGPGMISQERLYEYVRKFHADQFDAVESYPHEPPMKGNYYLHPRVRPRRSYDLTEQFLDFFSPATDVDRELIRAAILTPFWGGTPGARPAFRFAAPEDDPPELGGRGVGKTKSVELIAAPCGGLVDLRENENISDLITRLLSEEGQSKRILRIDNVKTLRLSWADLEALITTKELSGKRLYRGEGRRPNVLTTFITVNGGSLSKDMAVRQITICVARPKPSGTWLRDAFGFVETHRWELIGEFLGALSDEPGNIRPRSRWDEWENEVLGRVPRWDECQDVIAQRAKDLDADEEDARECEEFFARKLEEQQHNSLVQSIRIPISKVAEWVSEYEGKPIKTGVVTRFLKLKPLKRLSRARDKESRFWLWVGAEADTTAEPVDLGGTPRIPF
jgi:hypothetical protein